MSELLELATAILESVESEKLTNETLSNLRAVIPEKLIEASLDIIDRGHVIHFVADWGHSEYEITGSRTSYTILLDLPVLRTPFSCTCPAFASSVLMAETHIMCKHVLACVIARKMNLNIERRATLDDLASLYLQQFPLLAAAANRETG